jgi:hypothetical protein
VAIERGGGEAIFALIVMMLPGSAIDLSVCLNTY